MHSLEVRLEGPVGQQIFGSWGSRLSLSTAVALAAVLAAAPVALPPAPAAHTVTTTAPAGAKPPAAEAPGYVIHGAPSGIESGHCDRQLVSHEVLGGGPPLGDRRQRPPKRLTPGAAAQPLVGAEIGDAMDDIDQNCVGRALEFAPDNVPVQWQAEDGARYAITAVRTWEGIGGFCREFTAGAVTQGRTQQSTWAACRAGDGTWRPAS